MDMNKEPIRIVQLSTAAVAATVAVVGLVTHMSAEVLGSLQLAIAAWMAVAGERLMRARVWSQASVEALKVRAATESAKLQAQAAEAAAVAKEKLSRYVSEETMRRHEGDVGQSGLVWVLAVIGIVLLILIFVGRA